MRSLETLIPVNILFLVNKRIRNKNFKCFKQYGFGYAASMN